MFLAEKNIVEIWKFFGIFFAPESLLKKNQGVFCLVIDYGKSLYNIYSVREPYLRFKGIQYKIAGQSRPTKCNEG